MDIATYYFFSFLETLAMLYLMFCIFKIEFLPIHMTFASIIMAFASHVIRTVYLLPDLDVLIQMLLMFCFVWLLFRIHIFYATIMTGMAYQAYMFIQTTYYYIMDSLGAFNDNLPSVFAYSTNILQTVSAFTAFVLGWWIYKKRKGFDFVPDRPRGHLTLKKRDTILFILNVPAFVIITFTMYLTFHFQQVYIIIPLIYALMLYSYLYIAYKKDRGL
jgi:hypothetical protein